ncbi:flagellar P-ring protein [Capsulimonas corticalis]|uniref:Flagellar P-ring protein n=1 Tax=Capsulimonas corticalis TaxID=2219043 RepID=A0A402CS96_9BACT|nr:flagellar basal body P-ring protein FlgI [Capsulimonas corticalis]BDI28302.1 flagellar P-ring protein [Capsulimonas corticalis]
MKKTLTLLALLALTAGGSAVHAQARLKDIGVVQGVRSNQLVGYGLVIGLDGTGDGTGTTFTPQSVASMLAKFGVNSPAAAMKLKNVAAVMVTAALPAFVKNGSQIDVTVSSLGDAKSLQGGTLLQTPLQAADGKVYAVAQGSVSVGGFLGGGGAGGSVTKNHVTAGRIPAGAMVEQEVPTTFSGTESHSVSVTLNQPDFTTAVRAAKAIQRNLPLGATGARAMDAATIQVDFSPGADTVNMIAELEDTPVDTDEVAKIVVNERTGTVVMGGNATITPCAIAHGNLTISVTNDPIISQPAPFSNGKTVVQPRKIVQTKEGDARLMKVMGGTTLDKVVKSLNALGVTPRDLISILQAMKEAGALHAEIEVL